MAISLADVIKPPSPPDPKLAKFTSAAFLNELQAKAFEYFVKVNAFKNQNKNRFKKAIVRSETFRAIQRLRYDHQIEELYKVQGRDTRAEETEILGAPRTDTAAEFLSGEFIKAVREGDPAWIKDVAILLEKIFSNGKKVVPEELDWHYYTGLAAWELLFSGNVPDKKQVRERAIRKRALLSLDPKDRGDKRKVCNRISTFEGFQPDKRHWTRIFKDLDLKDLPSAPTHPK
jgi:hypothetical protein